ncbi:MAG: 23S rRNA (cytidine(2498)-2'-O)-methyltransferase RlmM [Polyangiales bacterium]
MNRPKRPGPPARPGSKPADRRRAKPNDGPSRPSDGRPKKPGKPRDDEGRGRKDSKSRPARADKPARPDRSDRTDRSDRSDRSTRADKPARAEHRKPSPSTRSADAPRKEGKDRKNRKERPKLPAPSAAISTIPLVKGEWLYTTRAGYEQDLLDELRVAHRGEGARVIAPSLIASPKEYVDCAFARQAMPARGIIKAEKAIELDRAVTAALREMMRDQTDKKWALHVWFPDSEEGNKNARIADVLERTVPSQANALDVQWAARRVDSARIARDAGGLLAQVCVLGPTRAIISVTSAVEAHSLHAGGRARMRVDSEAPSRAAMKLEEALDWFGAAPSRGDQCVDLGAAPGGWTHVLLQRGAHVLAVDPGAMAPALAKNKNLEHIRGSAFEIEPESPVDWLFCDMVWRPLEVAAMLAKWARRGWASMLVANIKLPMKQKAEFVKRILEILRDGGWHRVRARQLYHDREEVTVCAHRK